RATIRGPNATAEPMADPIRDPATPRSNARMVHPPGFRARTLAGPARGRKRHDHTYRPSALALVRTTVTERVSVLVDRVAPALHCPATISVRRAPPVARARRTPVRAGAFPRSSSRWT